MNAFYSFGIKLITLCSMDRHRDMPSGTQSFNKFNKYKNSFFIASLFLSAVFQSYCKLQTFVVSCYPCTCGCPLFFSELSTTVESEKNSNTFLSMEKSLSWEKKKTCSLYKNNLDKLTIEIKRIWLFRTWIATAAKKCDHFHRVPAENHFSKAHDGYFVK